VLLESIVIQNYRSLADVHLDGLGAYNVLIGKNNSGKSSVLNAIELTTRAVVGPQPGQLADLITDHDDSRALAIKLVCRPDGDERDEFVSRLAAGRDADGQLRAAWLNSPLARQVAYSFASEPGQPLLLHLREVRMIAQDNNWATVQSMPNHAPVGNPTSRLVNLDQLALSSPSNLLDAKRIESGLDASNYQVQLQSWMGFDRFLTSVTPASRWALERLQVYCRGAIFFLPFRHSLATAQATAADQLLPDGANLAAVLHTVQSNDRQVFDAIEKLVQDAVPGIGRLQSPLNSNQTFVGFRPSGHNTRPIALDQMGGGIEQLLMVALVLLTTDRDHPIFLEEPESHLHPGAQRFLLDRLRADGRQVVVATHSPAFIDLVRPSAIFRTTLKSGRTTIEPAADPKRLGDLLSDIGARNSDVLLSDAVLFVEGPTDRDILLAWSDTLGRSLAAYGVSVLPMGGGGARGAKARANVLESISAGAPIPHLFVLDRDERSSRELEGLARTLDQHLWILQRREIENYLLVPKAILGALRDKCQAEGKVTHRLESMDGAALAKALNATAAGLRGLVLLKRLRAELGTLGEGFLPREEAERLASRANDPQLSTLISEAIQLAIAQNWSDGGVSTLVKKCRRELAKEWADPKRRLELAPGEELLARVFRRFGTEYNKRTDGPRIARLMTQDAIPQEMVDLVSRAALMAAPND
jgi:predicted ATPase